MILQIAKGLENNFSLPRLYLKQNLFNADSLAEAIKAMAKNNIIQCLFIEDFAIN